MLRQLNEVKPLTEDVKKSLLTVVEAWHNRYRVDEVLPALAVGAAAGVAGTTLVNKYGDKIIDKGKELIGKIKSNLSTTTPATAARPPVNNYPRPSVKPPSPGQPTDRQQMIRDVAGYNNIPPHIFLAMIDKESSGRSDAVGDQGRSIGLGQLQKGAIKDLNDRYGTTFTAKDRLDPTRNAQMAALYLKLMKDKYGAKDWQQALAMYNGGPNALKGNNKQANAYAKDVIARSSNFESINERLANPEEEEKERKKEKIRRQQLKLLRDLIDKGKIKKTNEAPRDLGAETNTASELQGQLDNIYNRQAKGRVEQGKTEEQTVGSIEGHTLKKYEFTENGKDTMYLILVDEDDSPVFQTKLAQVDDGLAVVSTTSLGKVRATSVYKWVLDNESEVLYSDEKQTQGGQKLWKNLGATYPDLKITDAGERLRAELGESIREDSELTYVGNCTDDECIADIFGDATEFAQVVDREGDEFAIGDLVVKYDDEEDVHHFYIKEAMSPLEKLRRFDKSRIGGPKIFVDKPKSDANYVLRLERDADLLVLHITNTKTGQRTEVRGKPGYETDGYDANDPLHKLLDKIGKAANISQLMNGELVSINPKHPDAELAKDTVNQLVGEIKIPTKKSIKDRVAKLKKALNTETGETKEMLDIYKRALKKQASTEEIKVANNQFKDLLKVVGLGAFSVAPIPGGSLLIIALEKFLNKYNFSVLPSAFRESISEAGVGRVTKQNQTPDVGPNELKVQAKKMGFKVDKDGRPPLLHKTAAKNSDPNTLFNMGLAEGQLNEKGSIGIPLSSGLTVMIHPRRPLKIKQSKKKVKMVGAGGEQ